MSGALTAAQLNPQPERWGAMRAGNNDTRTRDTTPDLGQINDTIGTASATVVRRDGTALSGNDLAWTGGVVIDATRRIVSVGLVVGSPTGLTTATPIDYMVTITVNTTGGRVLSWDAFQLVVAQIG